MITVEYNSHRLYSIKLIPNSDDDRTLIWHVRSMVGQHGYKYLQGGDLLIKPSPKTMQNIFTTINGKGTFSEEFCTAMLKSMRTLEQTISGMLANDELTMENAPDFDTKIPLWRHQKYGVAYALNLPYSALLWEMRTGKTPTAITVIAERIRTGDIDKALVVAPLSILKTSWEKDIVGFSNLHPVILQGTKKKKLELLRSEFVDIFITNYESLLSLQHETEFNDLINERTMIVCDETSKIKNPYAKRTKVLFNIGKRTKYRLIMTGTPTVQGAEDVYSQFTFLSDGDTFGTSYEAFKKQYFNLYGFTMRPKYFANQEISDKMYKISTRFLQAECIDVPKKSYVSRDIVMSKEQGKIYQDMLSWCIAEIEGMEGKVTAPIILTKLLRLSQITSGHVKDELKNTKEIPNAKIKELEAFINEAGEDVQVLVWSRFIPDFACIKKMCIKNRWVYSEIHGTAKGDRSEMSRLINDGEARVFFGNPQSAGYGTGLASSKTQIIVYYANSFSYGDRKQSEDRNIADKQITGKLDEKNVLYVNFMATYYDAQGKLKPTIDHVIAKALGSKKDIASVITRDNVRELLDLRG